LIVHGAHTIRRKMLVGLWLVVLMIALLSVSGISGVSSYRRMVKDLDYSLEQAPHNSELLAALSLLIKPLSNTFPEAASDAARRQFMSAQRREFEDKIKEARQRIVQFRVKLQNRDHDRQPSPQEERAEQALFEGIFDSLDSIAAGTARLESPEGRSTQINYIIRLTAELIDSVEERMPDPSTELRGRLEQARRAYSWHLGVVWATGLGTLFLFLNLARCVHRWFVVPIRDLHQGARRVANGDFDYRLECTSRDEMAELAADFNRMTERFQAIKSDLDAQVKERVKQLIQSERLAGIGFLAAGVAHEINNPLSAIAMAAESLEYRMESGEWRVESGERAGSAALSTPNSQPSTQAAEVREYLQMIQTESQRCRQITEKLLDFARGKEGERDLYDVTAIVREVATMTKHLGRFRDRTVTVDRDSPCYAWINGSEIKQVVLNLVANALESTAEKGLVEIGILERPDQIEISVRDNGCGMTPQVIEHLFEPFYTTKQAGKGTGLGLSISRRIVCDHGGTLEAESAGPGRGSTFRLRLPTNSLPAQQAA
jgi:signal transduction histidine kinase